MGRGRKVLWGSVSRGENLPASYAFRPDRGGGRISLSIGNRQMTLPNEDDDRRIAAAEAKRARKAEKRRPT